MSNVDQGLRFAAHCTAMGRGNPYPCFVLRLLCGLLLLASHALGIGHRRQDPNEALDAAQSQAELSHHALGTAGNEFQGTGKLVETEHKKLAKHLDKKAEAFLPKSLSSDDGNTNYLIASFPELRIVNYVRLPDLVWRPLVVTALAAPKALVVDEDRLRLYIADVALAKIVWYQLIALPDKTLISDGREHVAVSMMSVRNMALDLSGNLWFSGTSTPTPPVMPIDAIWKQPLVVIDNMLLSGAVIPPLPQWNSLHTKSTVSPLVLDAFSLYYGNDMEGKEKGTVVKALQEVPAGDPASGLVAMADNANSAYSIAVTPTSLFYGSDDAIYGVQKTKVGASCGATGDLCKVITDLVKKPTAMLWDGDGSIYVADNKAGAIYSFASGSVSPHALDKIIDAGQVWGLDVLNINTDQSAAARTQVSFLLAAIFFGAAHLAAP